MHGWGIRKTPEQAATDITLLGLADAIVTPSAAARETLRGLGLDSPAVQVISYGIDERPTGDVPDAEDAPLFERVRGSGSRLAVCIGTIGERKNQALLVEALPSIKGVNALFIGDGESGPLRTLATKAGVADRVHVLGYRADASRYLPMADALVLPSRNEGLPIVVLEALRAGVPVVGSAIPEIAEAVEDGHTGFLFTPDDAGRLAAALARAMAPDRRAEMRAQARQAFEARYGADRMRANYERLYADVRAAATTRA
jgi:glycosyltransferase involved in cell wall biosynthesis